MTTRRSLLPRHLVGLKPFGFGEQRPNNYLEIWKAAVENRDSATRSLRILREGVCDGCSLGTTGLHDWTMHGIHLCNIRLRLLRLNTMPGFDPRTAADATRLRELPGRALRDLGRIPCPLIRRRGDTGFSRIDWEEAIEIVAQRLRMTPAHRWGCYMTSRGIPNETYYAVQKAVRAMGTNSIDSAARVCHSPSTVVLKQAIGVGASTCSYADWLDTDLIVFIGSNIANNQPVAVKYLHYAKKRGTRVVSVNTYREPGMDRYWVPSVVSSALFGTLITDRFHIISPGGDVAFLTGVARHLIENGWHDGGFVAAHTTGFDDLAAALRDQPWELLERGAGVGRDEMKEFALALHRAQRAVFVWSMGVTQHRTGEDNVRALSNLALLRGFVGRIGCGLMPIRGHSGVQGGAEMGAYSTVLPGGNAIDAASCARLSALWGFEVPSQRGLTAPQMIDAAHRGELDTLISIGGNFLEVMPDPGYVHDALGRIPLRVHHDIVLSSQMLVDPADTVLVLPATTRYEIAGGVTETSTERRVIFSPYIDSGPVAEARPEGEVMLEIARRVQPGLASALGCESTAAIRTEIAAVIPDYDGIQRLRKAGDQFQYGGRLLCRDGVFPTPDGRAHLAAVAPVVTDVPEGSLRITTRRGKQFNTMVQETRDAITGADRDSILMNRVDIVRLGLREGEEVVLRNSIGALRGRVYRARVKPGSAQVHFPEGNVLVDPSLRAPLSDVPDYNATARVERT